MAKSSVMNPRPRRLTANDKRVISRVAQHNMVHEIEELEQRAHQLGMTVTAHALNCSKNALGWELAGNVVMAGKAARGVRAGEPDKRS